MKIKLPAEADIGFQMAPMIDIVFLLIIFFMIAARQSQAERQEINVPVASNAAVAKEPADRGTITIGANGEIFVGAYPATLEETAERIRLSAKENPRFKALLRVDRNTHHKAVRDVLKACADAGVVDVIFTAFQSEE
jgi:biopolymer transport protein ExbD